MKQGINFAGLATLLIAGMIGAQEASGSTPAAPVTFGEALFDAEQIASLNPQWEVVQVTGNSMQPYFGNHSILVVSRADFEGIGVGTTVVYADREGDLVSHKVVEVTPEGLRTMGHRNFRVDPDRVTPSNLHGVVVAVFHTQGPPEGPVYAANGQPLPVVIGKRY